MLWLLLNLPTHHCWHSEIGRIVKTATPRYPVFPNSELCGVAELFSATPTEKGRVHSRGFKYLLEGAKSTAVLRFHRWLYYKP